MSLQSPWSGRVLWQGKPHFRTTLVYNAAFWLMYYLIFTIVFFVYDGFFHPDRVIYTLAAGLTLVPFLIVVVVALSYLHLRHYYVVTSTHIYTKGGKTWESCPLERVLSIDVKKALFVQQLGTYLDIRIDFPGSEEQTRTVTKSIQFQHLESPYTVKEIIEKAVKAVKMQIPPQKPWSEHVLWKGKPHFLKAMVSSVVFVMVSIMIVLAVFIASDWLRGSGVFILGRTILNFLILMLVSLLAILGALGSTIYLQHLYVVTPTHLHVRKKSFWDMKKGSAWESYPLEKVLSVDVRKCFFVPQLGLCLDICVDLSGSESPTHPLKCVRLEYVESPYTVKKIIEKAVKAEKNSFNQ
ncbi:MAG: hypothetical protein AYK19_02745 [Theionarchaea archaeon DG-70-1]|nr:MAG: hypothetical protein AYK19_02745 [Theionarchaea archaeon DG-70-1]